MTCEREDLEAIWRDLRAHIDQLAGERQQYLDFFEQSPEAYLVTDAQGTIVDANGAASDILQRRRHFLRGRPLAYLVALERRAAFRSHQQRLLGGDAQAPRTWRTVLEAPELRTEVELKARVIPRAGGIGGVCWLLQAVA